MVFSFSDLKERRGYVPGHNVRTDLALEAHEVVSRHEEIPGVEVEKEKMDGITVNRVRVATEQAAAKMGKEVGSYLTLEVPGLRKKDTLLQDRVIKVFYKELQQLFNLNGNQSVLVIGLGNWNVTPDALGPRVVKELLITRHIMQLETGMAEEGYRPVCGVAPGVLGITGIETGEIIRGIADHVKPDLIVAIDALAAQRLDRLNTTIQVADSGVVPGSGVGNQRLGINKETMGVPTFAIGVPTVVDAVTIVGDSMEHMAEALKKETPQDNLFYNMLSKMDWKNRREMIYEVLNPYSGGLIVTPKEIDTLIEDISVVIAASLDAAFHPPVAQEEEKRYQEGS